MNNENESISNKNENELKKYLGRRKEHANHLDVKQTTAETENQVVCSDRSNSYEIIVLFTGYSRTTDNGMLANCTCTLLKGPKKIIVDTMSSWDGTRLKNSLRKQNITTSEIDYVICTHGHSDHIGCNYLFQKAIHIVGYCISKRHTYFDHDFTKNEYIIDDRIKVIATPGHTLQDVTVIVSNDDAITAITGDLFEKEEDLNDDNIWMEAGSDNPELQIKNRNQILKIADFIIPGHGPMFKNILKIQTYI